MFSKPVFVPGSKPLRSKYIHSHRVNIEDTQYTILNNE